MNETEARKVLLVRTIEALDRRGDVLPRDLRVAATARALRQQSPLTPDPSRPGPADPVDDRFIVARAEHLFEEASARRPAIRSLIDSSPLVPRAAVALPVAGFLMGGALGAVLDDGQASLVSPPLLVIVGWNLVAALVWLAALSRGRAPMAAPHPIVSAVSAWLSRQWEGRFMIASRFTKTWLVVSAPLLRSRISSTLHLSAAMVALGANAWITAAAPARGLPARTQGIVLLVTGVVLPRLWLWHSARRRARRLSAEFPLSLEGPYLRSLLEDGAGPSPTEAALPRRS